MRADGPVEGVGGGLEVCEERDGAFEVGELARRDGVEAGVVEGAVEGSQLLRSL